MEGSLVAYKVFTNGSVLQASEVNENLMQQAVATFSNAAARTAAITSPVEGQLTYLLDVDRYEWWTGSAWRSPFGMTLVSSTSFTAQSTVTVNNVFSAIYENYYVDLTLTQNTAASDTTWTLVNGGTPAASNWGHSTYGLARTAGSLTVHNSGGVNQATPYFFAINATQQLSTKINLSYPFATTRTLSITQSIASVSGFGDNHGIWSNATLNNSTSYEGFRVSATAGTMTGTLKIFGIRNS
jgi:hypothetical protein